MINRDIIKTEKGIRTTIKKCLNKEIHASTKPNVDFIVKILDEAYAEGLKYDVSDLENEVIAFAMGSTNQAELCLKLVNKMKFASERPSESTLYSEKEELVFYDVEVFPNLLLVNWKMAGKNKPVVRMINPKPEEIEDLLRFRLVGFNCRRYDNHILYACLLGYNNGQIYDLSQKIISSGKGNAEAFFGEAYNLSYTDVYDFAAAKQSLKKWEIELGIHHQELGLPWDQPVPEDMWIKVAEYCDNDVIATEAVFNHLKDDFAARQILADVAGMTVNDTTNMLTTRIIFGMDRKPQNRFKYRNLGDPNCEVERFVVKDDNTIYTNFGDEYTVFDVDGRPIFPGYIFDSGISTYRGEEVGEGGYVYSEPGMYGNVALLDVASMHPASIIAEDLFGPEYTQRFKELRDARIAIKEKDFEKAKKMLNGAMAPYLESKESANNLAQALKIAINSVYGLTSAHFDSPFRDIRNRDNIVAKRGALFMINLKHEIQFRGFKVAHIKTDSIKIPDATPDIIQFAMNYANMYGYSFKHEATYDRMCLVNDAVYVAKYKDGEEAGTWTAVGTQFQIPYVFKKLFTKEKIIFDDLCETKAVTTSLYLDMNETLPDVSILEKELAVLIKNDREPERQEELVRLINDGHYYIFIGRVGRFCPIKPGRDGGLLLREKDGKYYAATGSKNYRWLEAETVKTQKRQSDIDRSYYDSLVNKAISAISEYGDFEWFVSDDPYIPMIITDELPWVTNDDDAFRKR